MNLLKNEHPLVINSLLIKKIGLNGSIILHCLHGLLCESDATVHLSGRQWVGGAHAKIHQQLPFMSIRTIQRAILRLEKIGIIESETPSKTNCSRTKLYTINTDLELRLGQGPNLQAVKVGVLIHQGSATGHPELDKIAILEKQAVDAVISFARENRELLGYIARWGDGRCGHIANLIAGELGLELEASKPRKAKDNRRQISRSVRNKVFDLYGNQCLACKSYDDISIDHVIPVSAGGPDNLANMQPLCRSCNSKKGVKTIDYRITGREQQ